MHEIFIYAPGLITAIGFVAVLAMALRQERVLARIRDELDAERTRRARLDKDFRALLSCSRNIADKLRQLRKTQHALREQIRWLQTEADGTVAAAHAAKLMDKGIALEEISRICELTRGEVELLSRLSKYRKVA